MERLVLPNRYGETIVGLADIPPRPHGMAFLVHGLGGHKEEPILEVIAHSFVKKGIAAIRFDTTKGLGESDGKYENATTTNFIQDLEDVIDYTHSFSWYKNPFYLVGHSLGGMAVSVYAEKHTKNVKALAPIATVVSGKLTAEVRGRKYIEDWKRNGTRTETNPEIPGLKWSHMEDRFKYNILPKAHDLSIPVLLIVGEKDTHTPLLHQKILFQHLKEPKELHILKNASHELNKSEQIDTVEKIFSSWIEQVESSN